ncbi:MAG: hypothetical protein NTZ74_08225 [Chloroflexi bacterium]|nr:hypothetical protein [Chloroflexota bacterium]
MSRVINPDTVGKDRIRLSKSIVLALRELMKQSEPNETTKDLAAFVVMALQEINSKIDVGVAAWEKRGYWIKADRFRLEWEWSGNLGLTLKTSLFQEDWGSVAITSAKIAQRLNKITVADRHRLGTPWVGAWEKLNNNF